MPSARPQMPSPTPSTEPSLSPSAAPTPHAVLVLANCVDSDLRLKIPKSDGTYMSRYCEWVRRRDTFTRCTMTGVSEACPQTCGTCLNCQDLPDDVRFKFTYNDKYIGRNCEYIGRQENKIPARCAASGNICRSTCGVC